MKTDAFLPLSPQVFYVMLALRDGPRHGYGIMLDVDERTGGSVRLGPGTLYGSLKRMLAQKLVAEAGSARDPEAGERRRYYRLTELGRRVLEAETARLKTLVRAARAIRPARESF